MSLLDESEPQHLTMIRQATAEVVTRLGFWLDGLGISATVDEVQAQLVSKWARGHTAPGDRFLNLNMARSRGSVDNEVIVEMAFAALTASMCTLRSDPAQALQWLLKVEHCIGYADGLSTATLYSEQKRQAAKHSPRSAKARELKSDVLDFIAKQQPSEGWNRAQAIQHYTEQPFEQTSDLVQKQGLDKYWVDMDTKLHRWLREPDFSKAFDALLKA